MKITYIHQHFKLPNEGGGSRPYEFARRMILDGHTVTMICGGEEGLTRTVDGITVKRLKVPYRNAMTIPERMWAFFLFMVKSSYVAAQTKTNIIYASSTPLTVAVPGIIGKIFQRVPLVFEVRDLWPSVPIELGYLKNPFAIGMARKLEKVAYFHSDRIVALSPGMRDGVLEIEPEKEVTVIPNACDFDFFAMESEERKDFRNLQGWKSDETVVVYAGGFGPTYRLDWAIRLAAAVQKDNIRFVLIGEGKDSPALHALAAELGLEPEHVFIGLKSKSEAAKYISAGDIVLSSLREDPCLRVNSLNKVFDGLAAGKPLVVNHEGWLKDAIVEAGAGWHLDGSIPIEKAAQQLRVIARDASGLEAAGKNSIDLGKKCFDRDLLYRELIGVMDRATSGKKPPIVDGGILR